MGGMALSPELAALAIALIVYNASFIAELVRGSIEAVGKGQREAASALGLDRRRTLKARHRAAGDAHPDPAIDEPVSALVKASSLATVIGYPDLVNVFVGTSLNQTGRAIEIMVMTMGVYLTLSLMITGASNRYGRMIDWANDDNLRRKLHQKKLAAGRLGLGARQLVRATHRCRPHDLHRGCAGFSGLANCPWALLDATWTGESRAACRQEGACWAFVTARAGQFIYGFYPADQRWRVDAVFIAFCAVTGGLATLRGHWRNASALVLVLVFPVAAYLLLHGGVPGSAKGDDREMGRVIADPAAGSRRHRGCRFQWRSSSRSVARASFH